MDGATEVDAASPEHGELDDDHSWSWHAARVSGLFLLVLVPLHFVVVVIVGDIGGTSASAANSRLHSATWRAVEAITILLALAHAFFALQSSGSTSEPSRRRDRLVVAAGVAACLLGLAALTALGTRR